MRIMTFNVWEGATDTARYENIKTLVRGSGAEVVCLQEANGWHEGGQPRLENFACDTGLTEVAFGNSNTASKLAIFSKHSILGYIVHKDQLHHCAVQAWIESEEGVVEVVNWHGNPFSEDGRLLELNHLIPQLGEDALLMGDLNSMSRQDEYPATLWKTLVELGNERYGNRDTGLRFDVTDRLALYGFIDIAAKRKAKSPTFPAMTGLEAYQHPTRFDYVFTRPKAAAAIRNIQVVMDSLTAETSDHHPLIVDVDAAALCGNVAPVVQVEPARPLRFSLQAA